MKAKKIWGMKAKQRLDAIAYENLLSGGDRDIGWMIERIRALESALEFIEDGCLVPPDGGSPEHPEDCMRAARTALEGDE